MGADGSNIEQFLRLVLDEPLEFAAPPIRLEGRRSADLFRFRLSTGPAQLAGENLVLRVLPRRTLTADECVIQETVARVGYPAPEVICWGTIGGRAYMIMRFVGGASLFDAQGPLRSLRVVPDRLAALMAALHQLDVTPIRDALTSRACSAALDGCARALSDVATCFEAVDHPARDHLHRWFNEHRSAPGRHVVCHGDLHAFNVLVNSRASVLDWELGAIGEPELDVARTKLLLRAVPMELPKAARPIIERLGMRAAARFENAYRSVLPLRPEAIRWYEALHAARMVGLLLREGSRSGERVLAAWRPTLPLLIRRVALTTGVELAR